MSGIVKAMEAKRLASFDSWLCLSLLISSNISIRELNRILSLFPSLVVAFPDQTIAEHKDEQIVPGIATKLWFGKLESCSQQNSKQKERISQRP